MPMKYLIGIFIGVYIGYLTWHQGPTPEPVKTVQVERPAPRLKLSVGEKKVNPIFIPHEKILATPVTKAIAKVESRLITLSSHTIAEMENNWNNLGQDIRVAREDDGWRITELGRNSLFAKAGFVKGDLITEKAVAALHDSEVGYDNLPERFSRILRSITN
jgi:hypothetical protein